MSATPSKEAVVRALRLLMRYAAEREQAAPQPQPQPEPVAVGDVR